MNRKPRFFAVIVSAAITFSILMVTIGPRHFNHFKQCHNMENGCSKTQSETQQPNPVK